MKHIKYAVATLAIIASINAQAFEEKCNAVASLAHDVMEARQLDIPQDVLLNSAERSPIFDHIIFEAYKEKLVDEAMKKEIAVQYSNRIYNECWRANEAKRIRESI